MKNELEIVKKIRVDLGKLKIEDHTRYEMCIFYNSRKGEKTVIDAKNCYFDNCSFRCGIRFRRLPKLFENCNISNGELTVTTSGSKNLSKLLDDHSGILAKITALEIKSIGSQTKLPPSIGYLAGLRKLTIRECSFEDISNVMLLTKLKELNIREAENLAYLPQNIGDLTHLHILSLKECTKLSEIPEDIGRLKKLYKLTIEDNAIIKALPNEIGDLENLKILIIRGYEKLTTLPAVIGKLAKLRSLLLSYMTGMKSLPDEIGKLNLSVLRLTECNVLHKLPDSVGKIATLKLLDISRCKSLKALPNTLGGLINLSGLRLECCNSLKTIPASLGNLANLRHMLIFFCEELTKLPEQLGALKKLEMLSLVYLKCLKKIPSSIRSLTNLNELHIMSCEKLEQFPAEIAELEQLKTLLLCKSPRIELTQRKNKNNKINFDICALSHLEKLQLIYFDINDEMLKKIQSLSSLTQLEFRRVENWDALPHALAHFGHLDSLRIMCCENLAHLYLNRRHKNDDQSNAVIEALESQQVTVEIEDDSDHAGRDITPIKTWYDFVNRLGLSV